MRCKRISMTAIAGSILLFALQMVYAQATPTADPKIENKRREVRTMAQDTLARLYKAMPNAKGFLEGAAGYAVFSSTGVKILVGGSGKGQGIAVYNKTKKETFMKMMELKAGVGVGVKKFRLIFVFENDEALNRFIDSGWEFGGQADAAAKAGEGKGASTAGAISISEGVWLYQLTDKGVALELTAKGTKYYKDDDLNK